MDPDIATRLSAIEYLLGNAYVMIYRLSGASLEDARKAHERGLEALQSQSLVKTKDPALSDHWSAETLAHVERFLKGVETLLGTPPAGR